VFLPRVGRGKATTRRAIRLPQTVRWVVSCRRMNRRQMLKQLGVMISIASGLPVPAAHAQARRQALAAVGDAFLSLTPAEAETLRAIVARIIPAENGPGALEAKADRFIDRALAGALKDQRAAYSDGLASIDGYARSVKGAPFSKLSPDDQDDVLTAIQTNSAQFFNLVRAHTIQGTFSDPVYGGNENFSGWNLIGYPGARVAVSADMQRMDLKPAPSRKSAYDYAMFNKTEL
jgi:gluconate 2-dehydrogenase gamma chain